MPQQSRTAVIALAIIMSIRMFGLFMILPIFSVYAATIEGATATLIGVTLGIYGLTQALFQIPLGAWSDRVGRKTIIVIGLGLLCIGSVIAAISHSMHWLIVGRALQGAGAIGSTVLALVADITHEESRSKAMALMGLSIGCAFVAAMIAGPIINHWLRLSGIFWMTSVLALIGMSLLWLIPTPPKPMIDATTNLRMQLKQTLHNATLWRLNIGIFALHAILTALFIAIPIVLTREITLSESQQIWLYFSILIGSFMLAVPLIVLAEKKQKIKTFLVGAIMIILFTQFSFIFLYQKLWATIVLLLIFFAAFTLLEATLPSLVSKIAPPRNKGAAMGVYSSSQFFGIFVGGLLGGLALSYAGLLGVFCICTALALAWLQLAIAMPITQPEKTENMKTRIA